MQTEPQRPWTIRYDLISARVLLWVAHTGGRGEPRPEVHVFFYDRYWRLALHYEKQGKTKKARRLKARAEEHWRLSGFDGPPFKGALGLPVPRPGGGSGEAA